jgi:hypothetical protein
MGTFVIIAAPLQSATEAQLLGDKWNFKSQIPKYKKAPITKCDIASMLELGQYLMFAI